MSTLTSWTTAFSTWRKSTSKSKDSKKRRSLARKTPANRLLATNRLLRPTAAGTVSVRPTPKPRPWNSWTWNQWTISAITSISRRRLPNYSSKLPARLLPVSDRPLPADPSEDCRPIRPRTADSAPDWEFTTVQVNFSSSRTNSRRRRPASNLPQQQRPWKWTNCWERQDSAAASATPDRHLAIRSFKKEIHRKLFLLKRFFCICISRVVYFTQPLLIFL